MSALNSNVLMAESLSSSVSTGNDFVAAKPTTVKPCATRGGWLINQVLGAYPDWPILITFGRIRCMFGLVEESPSKSSLSSSALMNDASSQTLVETIPITIINADDDVDVFAADCNLGPVSPSCDTTEMDSNTCDLDVKLHDNIKAKREMWMIILDTVLDEIAIRKNVLAMCRVESPQHIYDIVSDVLTELRKRSTVRLTDSLEVILSSNCTTAVSVGASGEMEMNTNQLSSIVKQVLDSFDGRRSQPKYIAERLQTVIMNIVLDRMGGSEATDQNTVNRITSEVMKMIVRTGNSRLTSKTMVTVMADSNKSIYHNGKRLCNIEYLQQFIDQQLNNQRASPKPIESPLYRIREIKSPFSQTGMRLVQKHTAETYINTFADGSQTYQVIPSVQKSPTISAGVGGPLIPALIVVLPDQTAVCFESYQAKCC